MKSTTMNTPNKLTIARMILTPIFLFVFTFEAIPQHELWGTILFVIGSFTDFLDGHIARKRNMVTTLGTFFDTVADKLLVMSGFLLIVAYPITANGGNLLPRPILFPDFLGIIIAIVIIARELIVMALRSLAASKGVVLKADMYGKVKATFQFLTLIYYFAFAFIVEEFYYAIAGVAYTVLCLIGYVFLAITVILTILSMINYLVKNRQVFKEEKQAEQEKIEKEEIVEKEEKIDISPEKVEVKDVKVDLADTKKVKK